MDPVVRPSTPNTVMYDEDEIQKKSKSTVKKDGALAPPAPVYVTPMGESNEPPMPVQSGRIWTVEGYGHIHGEEQQPVDEEEAKLLLLEKEFEDFYEDQVHKSAGPMVFVSKMLGMLPVIWTEDEAESECKSYFNLYTFLIFIGWVGLAVLTGYRISYVATWPGDTYQQGSNTTDPLRFISKSTIDTYFACTWVASLTTLLFGVFKCRSMAEILFGLSEADAQLELREKHYDKLKRKCLYWIAFLFVLLVGHTIAFTTIMMDIGFFDILLIIADVLAHSTIYVLDLQFLYLSMVLCKRYRLTNKILSHISQPWKTFRNGQPPNYVLQNLLQYRFDQIFEPSSEPMSDKSELLNRKVPLEMLIKAQDEPKISKEEENTVVLQLDILRGIHADLASIAYEMNHLLGFQVLINVITSVIFVVMFGYFFSAAMLDQKFYWPYLILFILPAIRIFLIGHWGQVLECQSRLPFMTICQVSTVDGSPRLERQVQKLTIQMHHQCPRLSAAGYFELGRSMILKTIGVAVIFTFFMVKFQQTMTYRK